MIHLGWKKQKGVGQKSLETHKRPISKKTSLKVNRIEKKLGGISIRERPFDFYGDDRKIILVLDFFSTQ